MSFELILNNTSLLTVNFDAKLAMNIYSNRKIERELNITQLNIIN